MIGAFDESLIWPLAFRIDDVDLSESRIEFVVAFCMSGIAPWRCSKRMVSEARRSRGRRG